MNRNKISIFVIISFLLGILIGNFLLHFLFIIIFLFSSMMFLLLLLVIVKKHHFFIVFVGIGLSFGLIYSLINNYYTIGKEQKVVPYYNTIVEIDGEIKNIYKKSENYNSYIVKIIKLDKKDFIKVDFLLYTGVNFDLEKGQFIKIKTKIKEVENFSLSFNYKKYLYSKNIYFSTKNFNIEFKDKRRLNTFEKFIYETRKNIIRLIYSIYPKDEAGFLAGILIGAREDLGKKLENDFNNSGLTHLLAVSGFNITIIVFFLGYIFKFIPLIFRFFIISFFIVCFVFIVGIDNIAVLRAGLMGIIGYYILVIGRKSDGGTLLLFVAFLISLFNPLALSYDISFHLSFLAVLGLLYLKDFWEKIFFFLPSFFAIKESFILTLSAITSTLPIMIINFGQFSLLVPISNMIVGGIIPFAMLFGSLSIIGEIISSNIGYYIGYLNYFLLAFVVNIASIFGNIDLALVKFDFGIYGLYIEILYFMILAFLIIFFKTKQKKEE